MAKLVSMMKQLFSPIQPLPAGKYNYTSPADDPRNYRLHLRLESDGSGVMIVNASSVLHLNQTAAEYAYYLVKNESSDQVARKIAARYNVSQEQAREDYQNLAERLQVLVNTPDLDPETFLNFGRLTPFSSRISAPYRLDCALTYQSTLPSSTGEIPTDRVKQELTTEQWITILDKAWAVGIPHVIFTGGEPTLRSDLLHLLTHAQANEQVTGIVTDGLRLKDPAYLEALLQTGLDHLMFVLDPANNDSWASLALCLEADLFVSVHLTINSEDQAYYSNLLTKLAAHKVSAVSLSVADPQYQALLHQVRNQAASNGLELIWNIPVPYSSNNPVTLEIPSDEYSQGAGHAWLYLEPDGDVLPGQGINQVLGNFLSDPWEDIWHRKP